MSIIIKIGLEIEENEDKVNVLQTTSIHRDLEELLGREREEEVKSLTEKINKIIAGAIKEDLDKGFDIKEIEKVKENPLRDKKLQELYKQMSDEEKTKIDKYENKLKECKNIDEAIELTINAIFEEIKNMK